MQEHIRFYCGLTHKYWNYHLCDPGPYACISPIVGRGKIGFGINSVYVPPGTRVLQDSGAYGEPMSTGVRLSFAEAFKRQERHADKYTYADKLAYRASYDLLVDHRLAESAGKSSRRKILRCSESDGVEAVDVSVQAARFLDKHRNGYALALNV